MIHSFYECIGLVRYFSMNRILKQACDLKGLVVRHLKKNRKRGKAVANR